MSNRQSRAQLRLLVATLQNAGYDAVDKPIKNSRGKTWVSSVRVEGTPLGRGWLLVDEDRDFEPVARVRFDGDADEKLTREFKSVDDAIRYFARTLRSLKPGLSLKTRSYPHHGEGERLPLPNPAKMRASDLQVFADLKLELEELGIKTTEGMDGASFHLGAYLTDARGKGERLTVFRYVFPSTRARDDNRTQRTHPYAVVRVPQPYSSKSSSGPREFRTFEEASEHMLRVARAWKLGRKAALQGRPEDPDYRAPLPNPAQRNIDVSKRMSTLADMLVDDGYGVKFRTHNANASGREEDAQVSLNNEKWIITLNSYGRPISKKYGRTDRAKMNFEVRTYEKKSSSKKPLNVYPFRSYEDARAFFLQKLFATKEGRASAMRRRAPGEYRLPLPNPLNTSVPDLRAAEDLATKIKAMPGAAKRVETTVFDPAEHNPMNASFSLRVVISTPRSRKKYLWLREETSQRTGSRGADRIGFSWARSSNKSRYGVYRDKDGLVGREPFVSMHDGSERLLFLVREALYGKKTALREKHRGEYRLPLPVGRSR